jgi:hypothetical protein
VSNQNSKTRTFVYDYPHFIFLTRTHYDTWQGQYLCSVHSHQSCFGVLANPYLRLCCKEDGKRQEEDLSICCLGAFCFVWG